MFYYGIEIIPFCFYLKVVKIDFKNELQILFQLEVSIAARKTKLSITFILLIQIE
jgi:hypothetical protein